ncbi:hypothetical protein KH172YL63_38230 [Bacillus sp. KH172YL63]|nr:hypothetical protein KH172YL63_38230 [Bacillus sp. KH172YL63]
MGVWEEGCGCLGVFVCQLNFVINLSVEFGRFFNRQRITKVYLLNINVISTDKLIYKQEFAPPMSNKERPKLERMLTWPQKENGPLDIPITLPQEETENTPSSATKPIDLSIWKSLN